MLARDTLRAGTTGRHDGAVLDRPLGLATGTEGADEGRADGVLVRLARRSAAADSLAMIDRRSSGADPPCSDGFCHGCKRVGGGDPSSI